jgi:hypothetical protein
MGSGELVLRSLISIRCRMLVELLHRRVPIRHPNLCRLGQTNVMNTVRKKTYNNQLCYQLINILMWGTGDCHAPYPSCGKSGGLRVVWDIYSYVHIYIYISFGGEIKQSGRQWSGPVLPGLCCFQVLSFFPHLRCPCARGPNQHLSSLRRRRPTESLWLLCSH